MEIHPVRLIQQRREQRTVRLGWRQSRQTALGRFCGVVQNGAPSPFVSGHSRRWPVGCDTITSFV
ncbi:hypothetical protein, partial [Burkholderia ubonensis]|uniref:hypothetical protein n=1 Tax=Burkholderia ubonensis TaxID=101571 RepID=UPI001E5C2318